MQETAEHSRHPDAPETAPPAVSETEPTFSEFGVHPEIVRALDSAGITHTFAIQKLTLPLALAGEDVIGQARTGMGKTHSFGVPLLQRLTLPGDGTPQVLIVVPTRELCLQVTQDLTEAGKHLGVRTLAIYGGRPYEPQIEALRSGVDVVIGTPGRLLDLAEQRHLVLGKIGGLVLDEGDEMLDLGFLPDIERILRMVPEQRQTMLFSATMPGPILNLARTFLNQPTHIRAEDTTSSAVHERTTQYVYRAHALDKPELVARALQGADRGLTMIFTRTKRTAQKAATDLSERGFAAASVHGDLGQGAREQALRAFRTGKVDVLVATDVAARGIDVDDVTHVINYQCPDDEKTYIHRIGRTGRAGKTGVAVTLVDWDEQHRWKMISEALNLDMPEPAETYSTSQHLHDDLGIPAGVTGRLPIAKRSRAGLNAEPAEELDTERSRGGRSGGQSGGRSRSRGARSRSRTRGAGQARTATSAQAASKGQANSGGHQARPDSQSREGNAKHAEEPNATASGSGRRRRRRRRSGSSNAATANTGNTKPASD